MINSMTGYGRARETVNGREIEIDFKCVNHRYYEPYFRITRSYSYLEEPIKSYLSGKVGRGKIELSLSITDCESVSKIELNGSLAAAYNTALAELAQQIGAEYRPDAYAISRMPEVFSLEKQEADESEVFADVKPVLDSALANFFEMRAAEGEKLAQDISNRLVLIENLVSEVEAQAEQNGNKYYERLYQKMKAVLDGANIDESRIVQEAAIYADKAAVDEETVRLRSHISQMREFLKAEEPVGKKMDFLVQEFNREANTIGSKAGDIGITRTVVELKAQIEKIREQIQNIE